MICMRDLIDFFFLFSTIWGGSYHDHDHLCPTMGHKWSWSWWLTNAGSSNERLQFSEQGTSEMKNATVYQLSDRCQLSSSWDIVAFFLYDCSSWGPRLDTQFPKGSEHIYVKSHFMQSFRTTTRVLQRKILVNKYMKFVCFSKRVELQQSHKNKFWKIWKISIKLAWFFLVWQDLTIRKINNLLIK